MVVEYNVLRSAPPRSVTPPGYSTCRRSYVRCFSIGRGFPADPVECRAVVLPAPQLHLLPIDELRQPGRRGRAPGHPVERIGEVVAVRVRRVQEHRVLAGVVGVEYQPTLRGACQP